MCGITGFVDFSSTINKKSIYKMLSQIKYRGPDDQGTYFDKYAALGVRRLSIIDLKGGHQPISNEDESIWVVFNGEIYNYMKLRKQLKNKHNFKTKTDTEVVVHLYEQYGEDFPKFLNGMFAFAIWDQKKGQLILGRDFAGIKPLYFYQDNSRLVFGSELKTILKLPQIKREINLKALELYKFLGYIPTPYSIFENIFKLNPGTILIFSRSGKKVKSFWNFDSLKLTTNRSLDYLLKEAVRLQSQADVPVGVLLSGGIDSSLITYYLSQIKNRELKTFSISFAEKSFDESKYFNKIAQVLNTKHYFEKFGVDDAINLFPEIAQKMDEPLADPSLLPTYKLSKFTRKEVKVVLSGDGGDELFAGYPTYSAHLLANLLQTLPLKSFEILIRILQKMPISFDNYPFIEKLSIFLSGLKLSTFQRHLLWMSIDKTAESDFGFGENEWYNLLSSKITKLSLKWQTKLQLLDFLTYLTDNLLVKVDRASMFNSLEVRVPFLDSAIIKFAFTTNQKHFDLFKSKILLRQLLRNKLPDQIVKRRKKGFGIPISDWIHGPMKDFIYDFLKNPNLYDYFDKKLIWESFRKHTKKEANFGRRLWMLTTLSAWLRNWQKG